MQTYIWTHCYSTNEESDQALRPCPPPISDARAGQIVAAISRDTTLMNELRYWMSTLYIAAMIGQTRVDIATQLSHTIEADLRR